MIWHGSDDKMVAYHAIAILPLCHRGDEYTAVIGFHVLYQETADISHISGFNGE